MADEIPQDVMAAAMAVADSLFPTGQRAAFVNAGPLYGPIARAILAERERCAKIAEEGALIVQPFYDQADLNEITDDLETQCREVIAAAIRANDMTNHSKFPSRAEGKTA